jgi:hypothetical protein
MRRAALVNKVALLLNLSPTNLRNCPMKKVWLLFFFVVWSIAGCDSPAPGPRVSPLGLASPLNPAPASTPVLHPGFHLEPFTPGAAQVSGQGPIGFTLVIVDVTYGAKELGRGTADSQGNFSIPVSQPLEQGHLVGLTVDLPPEQLNDEKLNNQLFEIRGPGYRFVPNLVTVFDAYEAE